MVSSFFAIKIGCTAHAGCQWITGLSSFPVQLKLWAAPGFAWLGRPSSLTTRPVTPSPQKGNKWPKSCWNKIGGAWSTQQAKNLEFLMKKIFKKWAFVTANLKYLGFCWWKFENWVSFKNLPSLRAKAKNFSVVTEAPWRNWKISLTVCHLVPLLLKLVSLG